MATAVIGATGRVGSEIVRGVLDDPPGENDYTTGTFQQITGRPPRPVTGFLHEHRGEFA